MSPLEFFRTLGLFVRHPRPGLVKVRLAKTLGKERAAEIYEAFVFDLVERFRTTADRRVLGFAPNEVLVERYFEVLCLDDYVLWAQPPATLGLRMQMFFNEFIHGPHDLVVLVSSDCPTLPEERVWQAFELLKEHDCVVGPAVSGGWYLVGMRGRCWPIFEGVAWGGPTALRQSAEKLDHLRARLALLEPWYTVDTEEELEFLRGHLSALRAARSPLRSPVTEETLGIGQRRS